MFRLTGQICRYGWRRLRVGLLILGACIAVVASAWCMQLSMFDNFACVEPGMAYRSAQMSPSRLAEAIDTYQIRSILNLRGSPSAADWYDDEIAIAQGRFVRHYSVGLNAASLPSADKLLQVLDILRDADKPILIHCKAGADRTGLVAALYRISQGRESVDTASDELTLLHGHWAWGEAGAMDRVLDLYRACPSLATLREWVDADYRRHLALESR